MKTSTYEYNEDAFLRGATRLLSEYLAIPRRSAVFVCDPGIRDVVERIASIATSLGASIVMREHGEGLDAVLAGIAEVSAVVFFEKTTSHFGAAVVDYLDKRQPGGPAFFRVFDTSAELIERCFRHPRDQLRRLNRGLIALGRKSRQMTARSDSGTNLTIGLDNKLFHWVDSCGEFNGRHPGVLPPSEVATYSDSITGQFTADGAINTNFGFPLDVRLASSPIFLTINDSVVTDFRAENPLMQGVLEQFFSMDNCRRVGEVGLGTNVGLDEFVPFVSHINERFPSLHLGLGAPNQPASRLGWSCSLHLDVITHDCEIWFDDVRVRHGGRYEHFLFTSAQETLSPGEDIATADTI